jgi:3-oxoacyl-[acyl-carrier-protein] synthase II
MNRVVVTGLGAVTPVGNDIASMWESLAAGRHGIGPITKFDASDFKAKLAAEVKGFDPLLYMEKNEARKTDLFAQYAIASATQAVNDSGILGTVAPERFAVSFGSGIGGIVTLMDEHSKLLGGGPRKVSPFFVPMMISNLAAGHIAIRFKAKGSCICVVTACATGCNAVGEAFRAIKHGYCDAAIAGGSEAAVTPLSIAGFTNMTALSTASDPDAASLPFDKRRGGFVMGEGRRRVDFGGIRARGAPRREDLRGGHGLRDHLRRVPHHGARPGGGKLRAGFEGRVRGIGKSRRRDLYQRPRHRNAAERRGGDGRHQKGLRRHH